MFFNKKADSLGTTIALSIIGACSVSWTELASAQTAQTDQVSDVAAPTDTIEVPQSADTVEQSASTKSSRQGNRLVEEIIVTAQKREERLLDVPISISAFSSEKLEAQGVTTADDLARVTPGMTFTKVAGFSLVYIRGVGTEAFLPGADQSVPQYIDGVNILAGQGVQNTLGRVERVEVLKGPQGTLFGRNSTGGAINIVTPEPSNEFFGDATAEAGNYGALNQKIFVNLPILDNLAASISGFNQTQDEYYRNDSGPIFGTTYARGGQGKLRWEATDNLKFTLSGLSTVTQASGSLLTENTRPTAILGASIPTDPPDRIAHQDVLGGSKTNSYLISGITSWNTDFFDAKLILSDQKLKVPFASYDFDQSAQPLVSFSVPKQFAKQRTAELQFLSNKETPFSDRFEWVAGLYFLKGAGGFQQLDLHVAQSGLLTLLPGGKNLQDILNAQLVSAGVAPIFSGATNAVAGGVIDSKSASVYGQGTLHIVQSLDATLGARLQRETRGVTDSRFGVLSPTDGSEIDLLKFHPDELKSTQFAPRVALQWHPLDDTQIYTSASRGYQSPTYNAVNFFSSPDKVKEVRVDAYELGIKSRIPQLGMQVESAVFYTKEHDLTSAFVSLSSGGVVRFDNVAGAKIKGAEASVLWTPLMELDPQLAVTGGVTYLDARYTDYKNGRGWDDVTGLSYGPGGLLPARDFSGNQITRTPRVSYNIGINQHVALDSGWAELALDTYYNSGFYFLAQNSSLYATSSYQLFNASASYFYQAWNFQLTAYGQNLTNKSYVDSEFVVDFGRGEHLNPPRMFGLRAKWNF